MLAGDFHLNYGIEIWQIVMDFIKYFLNNQVLNFF